MLAVESGELWECCLSKDFVREIPGTFRFEIADLKIHEVSLCERGKDRRAVVALVK
jgi:hypothetical protein